MAKQLIAATTTRWQPEKYHDQYQTALMNMTEGEDPESTRRAKIAPELKEHRGILANLQQEPAKDAERKQKHARTIPRTSTAMLVKRRRR